MSDYDEHLISMAGGDGEPDLDQIQARLDAASIHDGPWAVEEDDTWGAKVYIREPGFGTMYICENLNQQEDGLADAEFIANAPADIRALLAVVRSQQAKIERVKAACDRIIDNTDGHKPPGPPNPSREQATAARIRAALTATEGA